MTRMARSEPSDPVRMVAFLLTASGVVYLLLGLVYNELLFSHFRYHPLESVRLREIRTAQISFLSLGLVLLAASIGVRRWPRLRAAFAKPLAQNLLLLALTLFMPASIAELTMRPLIDMPTTIYMEDEVLGWKLKPGAEGVEGKVRVKVNGKSLVGPELEYEKPPGRFRILHLGDSVPFGYGLEGYENSFPYATERDLEETYGADVETVDSGVAGYSPFQYYLYLEHEGIRYDPDLVTVSFVLNDVNEKLSLRQYGGSGKGWQLFNSVSRGLGHFISKSAVLSFAKQYVGNIMYGRDLTRGTTLSIDYVIEHPDDPEVKKLWDVTLDNLGKTFAFCRERNIPVILIVFPFTFQFSDPEAYSSPQKIVDRYAADNGVPVLDLLPILAERMKREGKRPEDFFIDWDHLSVLGVEVVGKLLAELIEEQGYLGH